MTFKLEISNLKEIIKHNQYYKAELLSANLIESGINPEKIILTRRDVETKNSYHDINDISLKYSYSDPENPYIKIRTGKDGIYDSIAEGLFFIDEN